MMKLYQFIDNRIYVDYYKLFSQIEKFLHENLKPKQYDKIKELKNIDKYPIYKDLDKFKTYDFDTINNVHQDIIVIIACVKDVLKENNKLIAEDLKLQMSGLNIDNYVINNQYKNMVLMTTNQKFENYLQVFHKYHYDLLCKFYEKIHLCIQHIDHSPNDERFFSDNSDSSNAGDSEKEHDVDDSILFNQFSTTPLNKHYDSNKNKDNQFFHTEKATFEKTLYNETQILDLSNTIVKDTSEIQMDEPQEQKDEDENNTVDCESVPEQNKNNEFTTVASKKAQET